MRRLILFLLMLCMFATSARLELLNLKQERLAAKDRHYMLHSASISLGIPLSGEAFWNYLYDYE